MKLAAKLVDRFWHYFFLNPIAWLLLLLLLVSATGIINCRLNSIRFVVQSKYRTSFPTIPLPTSKRRKLSVRID
jgi:hypothetical protein